MKDSNTLSSRERILRTLRRMETDHTPLYLKLWSVGGEDKVPFEWQDQIKRAEYLTGRGIDDTLLLQPPLGYIEDYNVNKVPGVDQRVEVIFPSGGSGYPLLRKVYHTPAGELVHTVKKTPDWNYGDDIYLFSDYNIPRALEHLIKRSEDTPRLEHLLRDADSMQMEEYRENAARIRLEAQRLGVAIDGGWFALGDAAADLCGMERIQSAQFDEPEFLEELLDLLLEWERKRIDLVLDEGADVIVYMAWYEGSDFWTPVNYRKMLKPRIRELINLVHQRGALFRYIITKGVTPILDDLVEIGVDCITGIDPLQDSMDIRYVKENYGKQMCLMGGTNAAIMFTQWEEDQIRTAVRQAMEQLARGNGFILFPVDNIFNDMPWSKAEIFIDEWKKCCGL